MLEESMVMMDEVDERLMVNRFMRLERSIAEDYSYGDVIHLGDIVVSLGRMYTLDTDTNAIGVYQVMVSSLRSVVVKVFSRVVRIDVGRVPMSVYLRGSDIRDELIEFLDDYCEGWDE